MKIRLEVTVEPDEGWRVVTLDGSPYITDSTDEEIAIGAIDAELFTKSYVAEALSDALRTSVGFQDESNFTVTNVKRIKR